MTKKISFYELYKNFKTKVVLHWTFTIISTIFWYTLLVVLFNLVSKGSSVSNFADLLPNLLGKMLGKNIVWERRNFINFGLVLSLIYAFFYYIDTSLEEELQIRGEHYTKNRLLDKFRHLPFEEKKNVKMRLIFW